MSKEESALTAPAALVGSLSSFTFADVLRLLRDARATGELQIVSNATDHHLWTDHGDIAYLDLAPHQLLQLASSSDGWFYFTAGSPAPTDACRQDLGEFLEELQPKAEEWRQLLRSLPLDALVFMSASTPDAEVRLSGDQWRLLGKVATCSTVREVLSATVTPPLETLRTLAGLLSARLLTIIEPQRVSDAGRQSDNQGFEGDAAIALSSLTSPASDPLTAVGAVPASGAGSGPGASSGPGAGSAPGASSGPDAEPASVSGVSKAEVPPPRGSRRFNGAIMPPPISSDPWTAPPSPAESGAASS